jgi:fermentation-respiration switch protein FrsA (DUF1100 family)
LAHSTADTTIPYPHALDLQRASGAELWTVAGVPHAGLYPEDPAGYTARVVDFFDVTLRTRVASAR